MSSILETGKKLEVTKLERNIRPILGLEALFSELIKNGLTNEREVELRFQIVEGIILSEKCRNYLEPLCSTKEGEKRKLRKHSRLKRQIAKTIELLDEVKNLLEYDNLRVLDFDVISRKLNAISNDTIEDRLSFFAGDRHIALKAEFDQMFESYSHFLDLEIEILEEFGTTKSRRDYIKKRFKKLKKLK